MDLTNKSSNEVENTNVESTRGYIYDVPEVDIFETNNDYKIVFDIPGIEKDDVNLKIEKDVLTMTADFKKSPIDNYECVREEMAFTGYKRAFDLNGTVSAENIQADYSNGTLTITLPKKEEKKTKEIKIKIA